MNTRIGASLRSANTFAKCLVRIDHSLLAVCAMSASGQVAWAQDVSQQMPPGVVLSLVTAGIVALLALAGYVIFWIALIARPLHGPNGAFRAPNYLADMVGIFIPFIGAVLGWQYWFEDRRIWAEHRARLAKQDVRYVVEIIQNLMRSLVAQNSRFYTERWSVWSDERREGWARQHMDKLVQLFQNGPDTAAFLDFANRADPAPKNSDSLRAGPRMAGLLSRR